jgi:large subunit ribosomal protein L13
MKSYMAKASDQVSREWHVVDAEDQILGRFAAKIARVLMGKHKPTYTPHIDMGDFVVVTNVEKIKVTGRKREQKVYPYYTGYRGGLKQRTFKEMMEKDPAFILREAVRRMLPKSKLGKTMLSKLKPYRGAEHPHAAQTPTALDMSHL